MHRELSIKHGKLYDDLTARLAENSLLKEKLAKLSETHVATRHELEQERKEHNTLKQENRFNSEQAEELKRQKLALELREVEWKHKREELLLAIHDRDNKVTQLKHEIKNLELMVGLKE